MKKGPIAQELQRIATSGMYRFFMPGHKGRGGADDLLGPVRPFDVTEISTTDNLYHAEGVIAHSEQQTAEIFGARAAYYCTNGCTGALHTALQLGRTRGRRFLLDRNCHKSIVNGAALFGLEVEFLMPQVDSVWGITHGYTAEQVENALKQHPADVVVITSPTYYSVVSDIAGISKVCKAHGALLIVDAAHGAHLGFCEQLPQAPWKCGADLVAISSHKTLPVLTQCACLLDCAGFSRSLVESCMAMTCSSSPSYLMMASLEYGARMMGERGEELLRGLAHSVQHTAQQLREIKGIEVLDKHEAQRRGMTIDPTRLVLRGVQAGWGGYDLADALESHGIVCEMADSQNVVLLPSVMTRRADLEALVQAVCCVTAHMGPGAPPGTDAAGTLPLPKRGMTMREALESPFTYLPLNQCRGHICGETKGLYPPGVCAVVPGEVLEGALYDYLVAHFHGNIRVVAQS